jgi:hypothetical protein
MSGADRQDVADGRSVVEPVQRGINEAQRVPGSLDRVGLKAGELSTMTTATVASLPA